MTREESGKGTVLSVFFSQLRIWAKIVIMIFEQKGREWDFGKLLDHLSAKLSNSPGGLELPTGKSSMFSRCVKENRGLSKINDARTK